VPPTSEQADPDPGPGGAIRRTRLAAERTYLAWWRSALAAFAVALAAGKLVPELADGPDWPFALLGAGFGLVGVALAVLALLRHRSVEEALARGGYAPFGERLAVALTAAGVVLGVATVALVLFA
jgi:putative membrane protein